MLYSLLGLPGYYSVWVFRATSLYGFLKSSAKQLVFILVRTYALLILDRVDTEFLPQVSVNENADLLEVLNPVDDMLQYSYLAP